MKLEKEEEEKHNQSNDKIIVDYNKTKCINCKVHIFMNAFKAQLKSPSFHHYIAAIMIAFKLYPINFKNLLDDISFI